MDTVRTILELARAGLTATAVAVVSNQRNAVRRNGGACTQRQVAAVIA